MDGADFVVAWSSADQDGNGYGIYAQLYQRRRRAPGAEFRVNTPTTASKLHVGGHGRDGDFVVAWSSKFQDGNGWGIFAQRYNAAGVGTGRRVPRQHHYR